MLIPRINDQMTSEAFKIVKISPSGLTAPWGGYQTAKSTFTQKRSAVISGGIIIKVSAGGVACSGGHHCIINLATLVAQGRKKPT